jgi:alginate O-acetyltransferase complex protein AlgI
MVFNTLHFIFFFIIITLSYFCLGWNGRWRLLLFGSCFFYMVFRPEYILILFTTIIVDYFAGIWIENATGKNRKYLLIISLITNIGFLAFFKYYDFFNNNLSSLLWRLFTVENPIPRFNQLFEDLILPIGLSFHTFQAMSYTIEVYRGNQKAEKHFGIYSLYVMFYPQLVAGPIERPQNVLPQFHKFHAFDWEKVKSGLVMMAWGMFKKVVIADRLAIMVDAVYQNPAQQSGFTVLVGSFFYCFQIYCDFSGYSEIALGAARVMGFELMENFKTPYFALSISEFWRRWHISLSTWFRDYLYIPLGGNRVGEWQSYFNQFFVFMISGLWHGAKWTFVVWGTLHGLYLILARVRNKMFPQFSLPDNSFGKAINLIFTFILVMFTWVFFRAVDLKQAIIVLRKIATVSFGDRFYTPFSRNEMILCLIVIGIMLVKEKFFFYINTEKNRRFWVLFPVLVFLTYLFGVFNSNQFIYFQF